MDVESAISAINSLNICSKFDVNSFHYVWKIENFSIVYEKNLTSPLLPVKGYEKIKFQSSISLIPAYYDFDLCLKHTVVSSYQKMNMHFKCSVHIFNNKRIPLNGKHFTIMPAQLNAYDALVLTRKSAFEIYAMKLLPEDVLYIVYHFVVGPIHNLELYRFESSKMKINLEEDFGKLLDSGDISDVTFVIENKPLRAHKQILAARSQVFNAMFKKDKLDNTSKPIIIMDIKYDVFQKMLLFIYTAKAPEMDKFVGDLLLAADKYAIYSLKTLCELALARNITIFNAIETIILADNHCASEIKAKTMEIISNNFATIVKQEKWTHLMTSHPRIANEVLAKIVSK